MPEVLADRARWKIAAGNEIRKRARQNDVFGLAAASFIASNRKGGRTPQALNRRSFVVCTLKRTEEVTTLRRLYGSGFFLIGLYAAKSEREQFFRAHGLDEQAAIDSLIDSDTSEPNEEYGQRTRDAFHLADVFVSQAGAEEQVNRFLDLIFGCPTVTPTRDEHGMFLAYASSLRSGDLARQVGAAIVDQTGDVLSVGCNEVPKPGGGIYGPDSPTDFRDQKLGFDSNDREKYEMMNRVVAALYRGKLDHKTALRKLKPTGLLDITEFGRAAHAEMEAILSCARTGRSLRNAILYTTTFPCHNCTRHIVGAGLSSVRYIEPYPKSKAPTLHVNEISIDSEEPGKVPFVPFMGIGPRRYVDLFSLKLGSGYPVERKTDKGDLAKWRRQDAPPRLQMQPVTYLHRELLAAVTFKGIVSKGRNKQR